MWQPDDYKLCDWINAKNRRAQSLAKATRDHQSRAAAPVVN